MYYSRKDEFYSASSREVLRTAHSSARSAKWSSMQRRPWRRGGEWERSSRRSLMDNLFQRNGTNTVLLLRWIKKLLQRVCQVAVLIGVKVIGRMCRNIMYCN